MPSGNVEPESGDLLRATDSPRATRSIGRPPGGGPWGRARRSVRKTAVISATLRFAAAYPSAKPGAPKGAATLSPPASEIASGQ